MGHPIRWGVLGCARIARMQVNPAILRTPNARLPTFADPEESLRNMRTLDRILAKTHATS